VPRRQLISAIIGELVAEGCNDIAVVGQALNRQGFEVLPARVIRWWIKLFRWR